MSIMLIGTHVQYEDSLSFVELVASDVPNLRVCDESLFIVHNGLLYHIQNLVWDQDMSFLPENVLNSRAVKTTINPPQARIVHRALENACETTPEWTW